MTPSEFIKRLDTQDNRGTAKPILIELQEREIRISMGEPGVGSYRQMLAKDAPFTECPEDLGIDPNATVYVWEEWETRAVFFTYEGYKEHLDLNRHNYGEIRDYVVHPFRNPEIKRVLGWVRELAEIRHGGNNEKAVQKGACTFSERSGGA